jgi:hypothetical protein
MRRLSHSSSSWGNQVFLALARSAQTPRYFARLGFDRKAPNQSVRGNGIFQIGQNAHFYWLTLVISVQRGDSPNILQYLALLGSGVPPPVYRYKSWCWGWCSFYVMANAHSYLAHFRALCAVTEGACAKPWFRRDDSSPLKGLIPKG